MLKLSSLTFGQLGENADETGKMRYRARLSAEDHESSAGIPLREVADILRQDRANFHRGTDCDPEDQSDDRFSLTEAQAAISTMPVTVTGGARSRTRIMEGTPLVEVEVSDTGLSVRILND